MEVLRCLALESQISQISHNLNRIWTQNDQKRSCSGDQFYPEYRQADKGKPPKLCEIVVEKAGLDIKKRILRNKVISRRIRGSGSGIRKGETNFLNFDFAKSIELSAEKEHFRSCWTFSAVEDSDFSPF